MKLNLYFSSRVAAIYVWVVFSPLWNLFSAASDLVIVLMTVDRYRVMRNLDRYAMQRNLGCLHDFDCEKESPIAFHRKKKRVDARKRLNRI